MALTALLLGFLSIVGFFVVLLEVAAPVLIYWLSAVLALLALVLGLTRRREKSGRTGMWLGLVGLALGIAVAIW